MFNITKEKLEQGTITATIAVFIFSVITLVWKYISLYVWELLITSGLIIIILIIIGEIKFGFIKGALEKKFSL